MLLADRKSFNQMHTTCVSEREGDKNGARQDISALNHQGLPPRSEYGTPKRGPTRFHSDLSGKNCDQRFRSTLPHVTRL